MIRRLDRSVKKSHRQWDEHGILKQSLQILATRLIQQQVALLTELGKEKFNFIFLIVRFRFLE